MFNLFKKSPPINYSSGHKCANCGKLVPTDENDGIISVRDGAGVISINLSGIICDNCVHVVMDKVPDPPGLVCLYQLSYTQALEVVSNNSFLTDTFKAVSFFVELYQGKTEIYDTASVRLYKDGYTNEALALLEIGISTIKENDSLLLEKACMLEMGGDPERGMEYFNKISNDSLNTYYLIKGNILKSMNHWDEASIAWEYDIKSGRNNFLAWNNLGYYYLHVSNDFEQAELHYKMALEQFPDTYTFVAFVGDSLCFQGKKSAAESYYNQAIMMIGESDLRFKQSVQRALELCQQK